VGDRLTGKRPRFGHALCCAYRKPARTDKTNSRPESHVRASVAKTVSFDSSRSTSARGILPGLEREWRD
jgi:hypothetical protein